MIRERAGKKEAIRPQSMRKGKSRLQRHSRTEDDLLRAGPDARKRYGEGKHLPNLKESVSKTEERGKIYVPAIELIPIIWKGEISNPVLGKYREGKLHNRQVSSMPDIQLLIRGKNRKKEEPTKE